MMLNPGLLALLIIIGSGAASIWVFAHRHIIWPTPPKTKRAKMRVRKVLVSAPKQIEAAETVISSIPKPDFSVEMISFQNAYKLVKSGKFTQTEVLCTLFDVAPGGSIAYKDVVAKYKAVAADLDKHGPHKAPESTTYRQAKAL